MFIFEGLFDLFLVFSHYFLLIPGPSVVGCGDRRETSQPCGEFYHCFVLFSFYDDLFDHSLDIFYLLPSMSFVNLFLTCLFYQPFLRAATRFAIPAGSPSGTSGL